MTDTPDTSARSDKHRGDDSPPARSDKHRAVDHHWPDLAGRIEGARHILPIRVYFEDTDFSGLVYHTSYLRWCERGRSDFVRLRGVHHSDLHAGEVDGGEPAAFVVRRLEIDYLRPARIDEVLEVVTQCVEAGAAYLVLVQQVARGGEVLCTVRVKLALVNRAGRPMRLPAALRAMV